MARAVKIFVFLLMWMVYANASSAQKMDTVGAGQKGLIYKVIPTPGSTYTWMIVGGDIISQNGLPQVTVNWGKQLGLYRIGVVETNRFGCKGDTIWNLIWITHAFFPSITGRTLVCQGETITLTASAEDTVFKDIEYEWITGETTQSIEVIVDKPLTLYCVVKYNGDAVDTAYININILNSGKSDFTWSPLFPKMGDLITFRYDKPDAEKLNWIINGRVDSLSGSTMSMVADSLGFLNVGLQVFNSIGCDNVKFYRINIEGNKLFNIPDAFTPNGDGNNDVLLIRLPEGLKSCKTKVFNRWGGLIFESDDLNEIQWNGQNNGQDLQVGTYIIDITAYTTENRYMHQSSTVSVIK